MILSERELELGADHTGIMVLPDAWEPGTPLAEALPLADDVLELETTPNRPDLLAVYGVAREVAALFHAELAPVPGVDPDRAGDEPVDIRVDDLDGCPRYVGRLFRDVSVGESPPWLRARLTWAGMRPISNVVDVTNYVMHALGNPLHAFDQSKLQEGRVVVRRAAAGEEIRTLDGQQRPLSDGDLVIADAHRPVAIAGIMGSADSEVDDSTTTVLLEAANFESFGIFKSSERLGLRTESSNRWEKGVDPHLAGQAATFASQLLVETAGATWVGEADVHAELPERPVVRFRPERADALIGLVTAPDDQRDVLTRLGFDVDDDWNVTVPTWRARDVSREVDLVEEVGRTVLDRVPYTLPVRRAMFGRLTKEQRLRRLLEDVLVGGGYSEVYTPSLVASDPEPAALRVSLPMTTEMSELRTTLLPSLVEVARRNLDAGNEGIALFEIARVYLPGGDKLPDEHWHLAGIAEGGYAPAKGAVEAVHEALKRSPRFERAEAALMHPGKAARVEAGVVGELHPALLDGAWGAFELDLHALLGDVEERVRYEDVITYPAVKQDLAFAVDEDVPAGELVDAATAAVPELREMRVFDVYHGEQVGAGKKSVAFRVAFQSPERTLSDEDAAALRRRIEEVLAERFGAALRA